MSCRKVCRFALAFAVVLSAGRAASAQSIVGDTVEIWGVAQSNGSENLHDTVLVVDPGIEYTATILVTDIYTLNFGPSSIQLNTLEEWYSPWFNSGNPPTRLELRDIEVPGKPWLSIGGASMIFSETILPDDDAPVGYPAFSADNLSYTADSVNLEIGPYRFPVGSRVLIDLSFVPEPGLAVLCGTAMMGGAWLRRRRG